MKILWLYKYMKEYDFDHHLHMTFAKYIATFPGISLKAYGPALHIGYPRITLTEYDSNHTLKDLHQVFDFDVVIINTKSRCFESYCPPLANPNKAIAKGCWLPSDFKTFKCPKIVLEEDYHYEINDDWYKDVGINLILQRHYSQSLRQKFVPMQFLPFSVDIGYFNPWVSECLHGGIALPLTYTRNKKFCFIGSNTDKVYAYRRNATSRLVTEDLAVSYAGAKKVDGEYLKILREYIGYISCGSIYEICAAKNFEIMASGGILLTNKFKGVELLYPENSYCSYENDVSDVVIKARKIINEPAFATEMMKNARECIHSKHTHEIRVKELLQILKGLK